MERQEREIEGLQVKSQQLPAMRAYKLMTKLGKLIEPVARMMTPEIIAGAKAGKFDAMLPVAMAIFAELDEARAESVALDILACTSVIVPGAGKNGAPGNVGLQDTKAINLAFTGNLKAMMKTLLFALEVTYKDFFPESVPSPAAEGTETDSSDSEITPT